MFGNNTLIMSKNKIELQNSDIDEICNILEEFLSWQDDPFAEIRALKTRFSVEYDTSDEDNISVKRGIQDIVYYICSEGDAYSFLSYLVEKRIGSDDDYNSLLRKYDYTIEFDGKKSHIVPLVGDLLENEISNLIGFVEETAPQKTLDHVKEAKEKFTKNDFDGCLAECRQSLESLTINNFHDGLRELAQNSLIENKNNALRKDDGWILNAIYGFNSTMGSHSSLNSSNPNSEQAFLGLVMTQSSLRYLLKKIKESNQKSINLQQWIRL